MGVVYGDIKIFWKLIMKDVWCFEIPIKILNNLLNHILFPLGQPRTKRVCWDYSSLSTNVMVMCLVLRRKTGPCSPSCHVPWGRSLSMTRSRTFGRSLWLLMNNRGRRLDNKLFFLSINSICCSLFSIVYSQILFNNWIWIWYALEIYSLEFCFHSVICVFAVLTYIAL